MAKQLMGWSGKKNIVPDSRLTKKEICIASSCCLAKPGRLPLGVLEKESMMEDVREKELQK